MDKNKLLQIKKRLLALGLAGVMMGTTGCSYEENQQSDRGGNDVLDRVYITVDEFYKYAMKNGSAQKHYNSQYVYLLYNKETYEVEEYLFKKTFLNYFGGALYNLESEELVFYSDGIASNYNEEYYNDLIENSYIVSLVDISDYIEGHVVKDYYTLEEIKELEPLVRENLKIINEAKTKIKQ